MRAPGPPAANASALGRLDEHGAAGLVAVPQVIDDRHHDGDDDAVLDAEHHHGQRGEQGDDELGPPHGEDPPHPGHVDELDADEEDDSGERGQRQPAQRPGRHQAHDDDHGHRSQLRHLAAPARAHDHLRLRRAAVHHERARDGRGEVGAAERHRSASVSTCSSNRAAYARAVAALWARITTTIDAAMGNAAARSAGASAEGKPRKARRHRAEHRHAERREPEDGVSHDRHDHGEQRHRYPRVERPAHQHDHDDRAADQHGRQVRLRHLGQHVHEPLQRLPGCRGRPRGGHGRDRPAR